MPVILDSNEIKVIDGDKNFTIETVKSNVIVNQDTEINEPTITAPDVYVVKTAPITEDYPVLECDSSNLVAWYKFDDDFTDSSGNGHTLITHTGTPTTSTTQYKFGKSAYLTSDVLKTSSFTFNNKAFSVAVWCYATEAGHIITQHQAAELNKSLHIQIYPTYTYRFGFFSNDLTSAVYDDRNQWVHLVFQIDSNKNREIWRNGVRIANDTSSSFLNTGTTDILIGDWERTSDYFGSYLDDFRIYDKALSAEEIDILYNDKVKLEITPVPLQQYTEERMYPPIHNFTSYSHLISGESYGNGVYEVSVSTNSGSQEGFKSFKSFNDISTDIGWSGAGNEYSSTGMYIQSNYIVPGYLGDWIKIKLPRPIKLTRYGFKQRAGSYEVRAPGTYKIYGSNDGTNWDVLVHKRSKISYTQQISESNDYFEENINVNNQYQYFALVVNELIGSVILVNFHLWYIYGQEFISEEPEYKTLAFTYEAGDELVYDFTPYNDFTTWVNYANSLPGGSTNVSEFNLNGVFIGGYTVGYFKLQLPIDYDSVEITVSNEYTQGLVNLYIDTLANIDTSTSKLSLSSGQSDTRIWEYANGDYLRIDETGISVIGGNLKLVFKKTQTEYTVNFPQDTECDILIVGGGGAGGTYIGGGGGAGGVLHITGCEIPQGTYNISVGKGGNGIIGPYASTSVNNGISSKAFGIEVFGGGYGGAGQWATATKQNGGNGGSGGAGGPTYNAGNTNGGSVLQPDFTSSTITVNNYNYYGGNGASGYDHSTAGVGANGGGGASGDAVSTATASSSDNAGAGADGIQINIDGNNYYWGGGGGGGQYSGGGAGDGGKGGGGGGNGSQVIEMIGSGGTGGITNGQNGDLEGDGTPTAGNGGPGTGGGGGGTGRTNNTPNAVSGSGGSGIVIIRYKTQYQATTHGAQWTYHSANPNTHHYGNVGIGTVASATQKLLVNGDMNVTGNYKQNDNTIGNWYKAGTSIYRASGNVGIGNTAPQYSLHVHGGVYAGEGGTTGDGTTVWTSTSDSRMKDNIFKASYKECYDIFKKIELYRYNFKPGHVNSNDRNQLGFIAQEVQQQIPNSVEPRSIRLSSGVYIHDILTLNVTQVNYILYGTFKYLIAELDIIKKHLESQEEAGQTE